MEKKCYHVLRGMVSATFLGTNCFLVGPPPAGNSDLAVLWPILGLWHVEKFRAWAKNTKTQFPGARATFGEGGSNRPKKLLLEIPQFF